MSSGQLKCIGATTYNEFRQIFKKMYEMSRTFRTLLQSVLSPAISIALLKGLKSRFEEHHGIRYSSSALSAAAELSAK